MNNTLIIPCAGRSTLNGKAKYLVKHPDGKLLIEKCIEGIGVLKFDRVIVTILREDVEKYHADEIIKYVFKNLKTFELFVLDAPTSGPAETVYKTVVQKNIEGSIVIKDSDNYISISDCNYSNFVAGLNLFEYEPDIMNIRSKSFIMINEQNHILDIVEKQIKSDIICLGLYGIKKSKDFLEAYKALSDENYGIEKLYISHIISYLIGRKGAVYHYIKTQDYETWGSDKEWSIVERKYATYFIDLDKLFSLKSPDTVDYDEIKYIEIDDEKLKIIKKLIISGAKVIVLTAHTEKFRNMILEQLQQQGVYPLAVICNCSYSIKEFINDEKSLKHCSLDFL